MRRGPMVTRFDTTHLPSAPSTVAPDGSSVRLLLRLKAGGMAHFELAPGQTSKAVTHRTVEEIWYFVAGRGEMWREQNGHSTIVDVYPGVCLTIPLGTRFQFRSCSADAHAAVCGTMPPRPGDYEALVVHGDVQPT